MYRHFKKYLHTHICRQRQIHTVTNVLKEKKRNKCNNKTISKHAIDYIHINKQSMIQKTCTDRRKTNWIEKQTYTDVNEYIHTEI